LGATTVGEPTTGPRRFLQKTGAMLAVFLVR
jgi:hypothetical protein